MTTCQLRMRWKANSFKYRRPKVLQRLRPRPKFQPKVLLKWRVAKVTIPAYPWEVVEGTFKRPPGVDPLPKNPKPMQLKINYYLENAKQSKTA